MYIPNRLDSIILHFSFSFFSSFLAISTRTKLCIIYAFDFIRRWTIKSMIKLQQWSGVEKNLQYISNSRQKLLDFSRKDRSPYRHPLLQTPPWPGQQQQQLRFQRQLEQQRRRQQQRTFQDQTGTPSAWPPLWIGCRWRQQEPASSWIRWPKSAERRPASGSRYSEKRRRRYVLPVA